MDPKVIRSGFEGFAIIKIAGYHMKAVQGSLMIDLVAAGVVS